GALLDQGGLQAQLAGADGGVVAARPAPDDHHVIGLGSGVGHGGPLIGLAQDREGAGEGSGADTSAAPGGGNRHGPYRARSRARPCGLEPRGAKSETGPDLAAGPRFPRFDWSGRGDSNARPSPWQGDALPLSYARTPLGAMCCSPSRRGRIADLLRIAQAPFSIFVQSVDFFRIALKLHTKTAPETPARTPRRPLQSAAACRRYAPRPLKQRAAARRALAALPLLALAR